MSVSMYEVRYERLEYGNLDDRDFDFLCDFRNDDGTYYIDEQLLQEHIQAYKENGKKAEIPQRLVDFLCEKVKQSEYDDLIIALA